MYRTTLRRVGGSIMLAIPPALLKELQLGHGARVIVEMEDGRVIVSPVASPRYKLEELLAQCDFEAEITEEDKDWINENKTGNEEI